jgi:hypothetical protein
MLKETTEIYIKVSNKLKELTNERGEIQLNQCIKEYRNLQNIIEEINDLYKSINNEMDLIIFKEVAKRYTKEMNTYQKLVQFISRIVTDITSEQIILTENNIDNEYRFLTIKDNELKTLEQALKIADKIGEEFENKTKEEIINRVKVAREYIKENNILQVENQNKKLKQKEKSKNNNFKR